MESPAYKIYKLEEVVDSYINVNGISLLLSRKNNVMGNKANEKEPRLAFDEEVDKQIERDFFDDVDIQANETKEALISRVKRYQMIVKKLKQKYDYKCQICGYSFHMNNGNDYCEAHHIKKLSRDGSQHPKNTIILCANHHRMFHYASNTCLIGELCNGKRVIKIGEEEFTVQF